jgi:hypothetical protein
MHVAVHNFLLDKGLLGIIMGGKFRNEKPDEARTTHTREGARLS